MGTQHRKYTKELLEEAVAASTSVMGVLRYLGMPQAGGTHAHVSRKIREFGVSTTHFVRYPGTGRQTRLTPEEMLTATDSTCVNYRRSPEWWNW